MGQSRPPKRACLAQRQAAKRKSAPTPAPVRRRVQVTLGGRDARRPRRPKGVEA